MVMKNGHLVTNGRNKEHCSVQMEKVVWNFYFSTNKPPISEKKNIANHYVISYFYPYNTKVGGFYEMGGKLPIIFPLITGLNNEVEYIIFEH